MRDTKKMDKTETQTRKDTNRCKCSEPQPCPTWARVRKALDHLFPKRTKDNKVGKIHKFIAITITRHSNARCLQVPALAKVYFIG